MRVLRLLFSAFILLSAAAYGATPINGQDYGTLNPAQPTESGKKVEVIEFFAYYCPHCNALDPELANWVKTQGDNIVFKRVHTSVTGEPVPQQRLFYALESMGKEEQYHTKILYAIHFLKKHLDDDKEIIDFMVQQGIDRQQFLDVYNSFTVQSKVKRAVQMQEAYDIHTWPTIVLDGRLVTSPPIAGGRLEKYDENTAQDLMLKIMDQLVLKLKDERNK